MIKSESFWFNCPLYREADLPIVSARLQQRSIKHQFQCFAMFARCIHFRHSIHPIEPLFRPIVRYGTKPKAVVILITAIHFMELSS